MKEKNSWIIYLIALVAIVALIVAIVALGKIPLSKPNYFSDGDERLDSSIGPGETSEDGNCIAGERVCCMGGICSGANITCKQGDNPVFRGCEIPDCTTLFTCEPL